MIRAAGLIMMMDHIITLGSVEQGNLEAQSMGKLMAGLKVQEHTVHRGVGVQWSTRQVLHRV